MLMAAPQVRGVAPSVKVVVRTRLCSGCWAFPHLRFLVMFATASPSVVEGCLLGGGMAQELAPELAPEVRGLGGDGLVRLRPA